MSNNPVKYVDPTGEEQIFFWAPREVKYYTALIHAAAGQFGNAYDLVDGLLKEEGFDASNLTLAGSSLGGALAAFAGSEFGITTITFNAAGVHPNNVGSHTDKVTNYVMRGDALTNLQSFTPLSNAIGKQRGVSPTFVDALVADAMRLLGGPVMGRVAAGAYLHFLGPMRRALKKESR